MLDNRFQRTQGVLHPETIESLSDIHILIAGVGGTGGQVAIDLARLGFGYITLADFDRYERHNMNRQVGCFESTLGQLKIDVVGRMCSDINPHLKLKKVPDGVTEENYNKLIAASDFPAPAFVLEIIDVAGVPAKILLHQACREKGVTIMTGLMLGFGASLIVFDPKTPPYDHLFIKPDGRINFQNIVPRLGSYFIQKYVDQCFRGQGHVPTCAIGATMASAMMVSELMRGIVIGKKEMLTWPEYLYIDLFDHEYIHGKFPTSLQKAPPHEAMTTHHETTTS